MRSSNQSLRRLRNYRRAFHTSTALALVLAVAIVASRFRQVEIGTAATAPQSSYAIAVAGGLLALEKEATHPLHPRKMRITVQPCDFLANIFWPQLSTSTNATVLYIPLYGPLASAILSTLVLWKLSRGHPPETCPSCGYPLSGLPTPICPECGHSQPASKSPHAQPRSGDISYPGA